MIMSEREWGSNNHLNSCVVDAEGQFQIDIWYKIKVFIYNDWYKFIANKLKNYGPVLINIFYLMLLNFAFLSYKFK